MSDEIFANFQYEIYLGGVSGQTPSFPIAMSALERAASERMSPEARDYVFGAAGSEDTLRANLDAFKRWRIVPRMLAGAATRDLSVELLGKRLSSPLLLAPVGVQSIVHPEGELATARAASETGVPFILSTAASFPMEEVAEAAGDCARWFQLYWPGDEELTKSFVARAEKAGYEAIVVTLDSTLLGWRPRDLERAYLPFLQAVGIANYLSDPVFTAPLDKPPEEDPTPAVMRWASVFSDPGVTWDDLTTLRALTDLPILLKGILHPDDATEAVRRGVNGIVVSNHGGRQIDGSIASLDALPDVVAAVPDDFPVLFDSGIRTGSDAFKALALGARAILLGRPYIWGLALGGSDGVKHVIRSFRADLDLALALSGHASLAHLRDAIVRDPER